MKRKSIDDFIWFDCDEEEYDPNIFFKRKAKGKK